MDPTIQVSIKIKDQNEAYEEEEELLYGGGIANWSVSTLWSIPKTRNLEKFSIMYTFSHAFFSKQFLFDLREL